MRVALTGATGFIGRYLVAELLAQGHRCRAWFRPGSQPAGLPDAPEVEWVEGRLNDPASTSDLVAGCNAVIHAAVQWPDESGHDVLDFAQTNLVGTLRLVEAARREGVARFVYISSCAVHEVILDDRPLDEAHPTWPRNHYGAHKAAVEAFVHSYGFGQGYDICALRPTGVYGLDVPAEASKWFNLVRAIVQGEDVTVRGGGKEVHAADVARAACLLLTAPDVAGQCYNCYDIYISQYEVAHLARQRIDSPSRIHGQETSPKHQIITNKLRALGMRFGGRPLLRQTVDQLLHAAGAALPAEEGA